MIEPLFSLIWQPRWRLDLQRLKNGDEVRLTNSHRVIEAVVVDAELGLVRITSHFLRSGPSIFDKLVDRHSGVDAGLPDAGTTLCLPRTRWRKRIVAVGFPDDRFQIWTRRRRQ